MNTMDLYSFTKNPAYHDLKEHIAKLDGTDLRELITNEERCEKMIVQIPDYQLFYDFSRQKMTPETLELLFKFAKLSHLDKSIENMFSGKHVNVTEDRAVLHVALRAHSDEKYLDGSENVVPLVHKELNKIKDFSEKVRSGEWKGATGKKFKHVICVGIGGSYLGTEFIYESLRYLPECEKEHNGMQLRFLSNVDPLDVKRATYGLDAEETLVVVISKTFTTAETMMNAAIIKEWLISNIKNCSDKSSIISKHVVGVSSNVELAKKWGIRPELVFNFWDWVGGRYSVTSAVGCLPLSLQFGYPTVRQFLDGARAMDLHFKTASWEKNLPVLAGLISIYNTIFRSVTSVAVLPYSQALHRFPAHIQQLTMESLGKGVQNNGNSINEKHLPGEIFFGESGTNGQHSFYQSIHQGREVQCEFIGFKESPHPCKTNNTEHHTELLCNLLAQADALAIGKTHEENLKEGCSEHLLDHKVFKGNRVSTTLILPKISPFTMGLLLAFYEHRVAVQGFTYQINAFDQWGVELGKHLAKRIGSYVKSGVDSDKSIPCSTKKIVSFLFNK